MVKCDERFFVTKLNDKTMDAPWNPKFSKEESARVLCLDNEILKGAFYMETAWFWPGKWPETKSEEGTVKTHSHDFDEVLAFIGSNPDDPYDLGGEVELWVDGKQNILDRSFLAFIPAGTQHCPMRIRKVTRPMFHFTAGVGKRYNQ